MATISRYLAGTKNVQAIFQKIQEGVPPDKFNTDHLKAIGFGSSGDRAVIPLLKDLGFLTGDGQPTTRYREYRDPARSKAVMADALREAYPDIFVINENITKADRAAVNGRFKSLHDSSDRVAELQGLTFFSLLDLADLKASPRPVSEQPPKIVEPETSERTRSATSIREGGVTLTNRFEIQLPATRDVEVFRAIFRAIREELLDD